MIGVGVSIDRVEDLCLQKIGQADIMVGFVELGINDDADLLFGAAQDIGETSGRADLLEEDILTAHWETSTKQRMKDEGGRMKK